VGFYYPSGARSTIFRDILQSELVKICIFKKKSWHRIKDIMRGTDKKMMAMIY